MTVAFVQQQQQRTSTGAVSAIGGHSDLKSTATTTGRDWQVQVASSRRRCKKRSAVEGVDGGWWVVGAVDGREKTRNGLIHIIITNSMSVRESVCVCVQRILLHSLPICIGM
jgi:hypothetical protein